MHSITVLFQLRNIQRIPDCDMMEKSLQLQLFHPTITLQMACHITKNHFYIRKFITSIFFIKKKPNVTKACREKKIRPFRLPFFKSKDVIRNLQTNQEPQTLIKSSSNCCYWISSELPPSILQRRSLVSNPGCLL